MKNQNFIIPLFLTITLLLSRIKTYTPKSNKPIKEIGGSLLEIISNSDEIYYEEPKEKKTEIDNLILKSGKENQIFLETKIKSSNFNDDKIIHKPFPETTKKMRKFALITLSIFGTAFLLVRSLYNTVKNLNKFFAKGVLSLSNQMLLLFICLSILIIIYTYGVFDKILINWEYIIATIAIFILSWIIFNFILIIFSLSAIRKWKEIEKCDLSFEDLKKKIQNNENKYIPIFEFILLKRYFFVPLFPVMKSSSFREDMEFSIYLEECLLSNLRKFFKLSWTSWVITVITVMFWNVFILNMSIKNVTIFLMLIPILGLVITYLIYIYIQSIYHKVVVPITKENISEHKYYKFNSSEIMEYLTCPQYLKELILNEDKMEKMKKPNYDFHQHVHQRPTNFYENLIIFGHTGFYFLLNLIQCICVLFVCWGISLYVQFREDMTDKFGKIAYLFIILCSLIYLVSQEYLTTITLKWFTVIDSIEMNRNNKCIQKMINKHLKKSGEIANKIYTNFKKIYFDIKTNGNALGEENSKIINDSLSENENLISTKPKNKNHNINNNNNDNDEFKLIYPNLENFLTLSFNRFQKMRNNSIDVRYELRPFLRSCGNVLSNDEIVFMLHLMEDKKKYQGTLNLEQLKYICGATLFFRQKKPQDIIKFVFDNYYNQNSKVFKDIYLEWGNIELFLNENSDYFSKEEINFMKNICEYIGDTFSLDGFIMGILAPRQYYAY